MAGADARAARSAQSIPVTLVSGFLGAGKTSLVNKLLRDFAGDKRIAVIENELGKVDLDAKLVSKQLTYAEDLVTISGGCVCCSLRKDVVKSLATLHKRSVESEEPYDNIVLETTGLAAPGPVVFTFLANPWVKKHFHLDSIVTVVDAMHLSRHLSNDAKSSEHSKAGSIDELVQQIAFADIVLLNKIDLTTAEQLASVEATIRGINAVARLVHTRLDGDDSPQWLNRVLDQDSFSLARVLTAEPDFLDAASSESSGEGEGFEQDERAAAEERSASATSEYAPAKASAAGSGAAGSSAATGQAVTVPKPRNKRSARAAQLPDDGPRPKRVVKALHDANRVKSVGITIEGMLDEYRFNMFMRDLLQEKGRDIFRCKGFLCVHGRSKTYAFQGIHETFQLAASDPLAASAKPVSNLVFIGRGLDKAAIASGLNLCIWRPLPVGWAELTDVTTRRPYYVHMQTGAKTWRRPEGTDEDAVAACVADINVMQPRSLMPRRASKNADEAVAQAVGNRRADET